MERSSIVEFNHWKVQQLISDRETIKKCGLAICVNRFLRKIEKTRILKRQINRIKKKNKEKNK